MDVVVVTIIGAVLGVLWSAWRRAGGHGLSVHWKHTAYTTLPPSVARRALAYCLREMSWTQVDSDERGDSFRRGEYRVTRFRGPGDAHWFSLPMVLVTAVWEEEGRTGLHVHCELLSTVRVTAEGVRYFQEKARSECAAVMSHLEHLARRDERRGEQKRRRRPNHRWYPGDEEKQHAEESPKSADPLDADLALFGLKRGATLEQVTKAYRVACHKYHPDRLAGQNVEPHLVELAVQRFKEVTAAYRRLRDRTAQHA